MYYVTEYVSTLLPPAGSGAVLIIDLHVEYGSHYRVGVPWSSAPCLNAGSTELEQVTCACAPPLSASLVQNFDFNKVEGPFRRVQPEIAQPNKLFCLLLYVMNK